MKKVHSSSNGRVLLMNSIFLGSAATSLLISSALLLSCSSSEPGSKTPADTGAQKAPTKIEEAEKSPEMVFEGPGALLPRESGDWKIALAPRYFGPENLYDLINGGAEIYVDFGLVKMVTAEYRSEGTPSVGVTAEVYDMGSSRGAFGRTARFLEGLLDPSRAGEGLPEKMASRGILGDGDLVIWKDRFLVHLTLMDERADATRESISKAGREILPLLASSILAGIEGDPPPPAIFDKFPADQRIPRSEAWHPTDLMGVKGLGEGFSVRYSSGDRSWTAFATVELEGDAEAGAWEAVKGTEATGRGLATKNAGRRLVGLTMDTGEMDEKEFDALAEAMITALSDR